MEENCGLQAGVLGAGRAGEAAEQKKLADLLDIINNTIERNRGAIDRYSIMNDGLTGSNPQDTNKEGGLNAASGGLIYQLIARSEYLRDLCDDFDSQNNRLNQIIGDG